MLDCERCPSSEVVEVVSFGAETADNELEVALNDSTDVILVAAEPEAGKRELEEAGSEEVALRSAKVSIIEDAIPDTGIVVLLFSNEVDEVCA
jgi:hypothetical protein